MSSKSEIVAIRKKAKDGSPEETLAEAVARVQLANPNAIVVPEKGSDSEMTKRESKQEGAVDRKLEGADPSTAAVVNPSMVDTIPVKAVDTTKSSGLKTFSALIKIVPMNIPTKDAFPSYVSCQLTPIRGRPYFTWTEQIGMFDDTISFNIQKMALDMRYYNAANFLFQDPGDVLSQFSSPNGVGRFTPPEKMGLNLIDVFQKLRRTEDTKELSKVLMNATDGNTHDIFKDKYAVIPEFVNTLLRMTQAYYEKFFIDPNILYEYIRSFENSEFLVRRPEILNGDLKWIRAIRPVLNRGIQQEVITNNPTLRTFLGSMAISFVKETVRLSSSAATTTVLKLLQEMNANPNRINEGQAIPGTINDSSGRDLTEKVIVALLEPRSAVCVWHSRLDDDALLTLANAILFKLLPKTVFDESSVMNIDNYIAKYLRVLIPIESKWQFDDYDAEIRNTNYLETNLRANNLPSRHKDMKAFLFTDSTRPGSGWGTTENYAAVVEKRHNDPVYGPGNGLLASPFSSEYSTLSDQPQEGEQFRRFISFVHSLETSRMEKARVLSSIFRVITARFRRFSDMCHYITTILRRIGRTGLFTPATPDEVEGSSRENAIHMDVGSGSMLSMLTLMNWDRTATDVIDVPKMSRYMATNARWWVDFTTKYYYVLDRYPKPYWKTGDRLDQLKKMMSFDIGFNEVLFRQIMGKPFIYSFMPPKRSNVDADLMNILTYIEKFTFENPAIHGYSHSFLFQGGGIQPTKTTVFESIYLADDSTVDRDVQTVELEKLTQDKQITAFFDRAKQNGLTYRIMHPINIVLSETRSRPKETIPIMPQVFQGTYKVRGPIKIHATFDEDYLDDTSDKQFLQEPIRFGVTTSPILSENLSYAATLVRTFPIRREGFKIMTEDDIEMVLADRSDDGSPTTDLI